MSIRIVMVTLLLIFLATIIFAGDGTIVRSQDPVPGLYLVIFRSNLSSPVQRQQLVAAIPAWGLSTDRAELPSMDRVMFTCRTRIII